MIKLTNKKVTECTKILRDSQGILLGHYVRFKHINGYWEYALYVDKQAPCTNTPILKGKASTAKEAESLLLESVNL